MTIQQNLIIIRMGSDARIPRQAMGYVDDLRNASGAILQDRLVQLARYTPDLVAAFVAVEKP